MKLRIAATLVLSASVLSGLGAAVLAQGTPAAPIAAARPQAPPTPSAQDYTANCAGCHGTDLAGGRGPSLFADALLNEWARQRWLRHLQGG